MTSTRQAIVYTFSSQYVAMGVQFASSLIIARLLSPEEIGVFAVCAAFVALAHEFREFGAGQYIIQEKDLTQRRIRAALTLTLFLGSTIGVVVILITPYVADFYEMKEIANVLYLLSCNFFLLPFGTITFAFLRRELKFGALAAIQVGATLSQAVTAVTLAYIGLSYMSLAWGSVANSVAMVLLLTMIRPRALPFFPGIRGLPRVLNFGGKVSVLAILSKISNVMPEIVLGKTQGFSSVGLYSRGQGILSLFGKLVAQGIGPVIGPAFAVKAREGQEMCSSFVYALICISGLAWAFYANLIVLAEPFVLTLYGEAWSEVIPLVQIWCVAVTVYYLNSLTERVLINVGEINRVLRVGFLLHPIRIGLVTVGAMISIEAVIYMLLFLALLRHALFWPHLTEVIGLRIKDLGTVVLMSGGPAILSAGTSFAILSALSALGVKHEGILLVGGFLGGSGAWIGAALVMRHPLTKEVKQLVFQRMGGKTA